MHRLAIITPVFNEAAHIDRVIRAMAAQTRRPDVWIVVDDGSTDDTLARLRAWEAQLDFLTVLTAGDADPQAASGPDRLAIALEARAFNRALATIDLERYSHIGKLDGDIELPPNWYASVLDRFARDPSLGIVGGNLIERAGSKFVRVRVPSYHVHGALKTYSRECFEAIDGIEEQLAWDTIDETRARMRGYSTVSFEDLVGVHLRPSASADGQLRGWARHGECAWILHYSVPWIVLRSANMALRRPWLLSGIAFVWGYARAAARGVPRVPDPEFRVFTRRELRARIHRRLGLSSFAE